MGNEIVINEANFEGEISTGLTLVDFWAPWCGPCRIQGPIIEQVAYKVSGAAKVGKCNVDENQGLAGRLGIQSIPTLILFENGAEIDRMVGVQQESVLIEKLSR
ncbi:MAG: thioredoxin [Dehalococcoidia bacterium]